MHIHGSQITFNTVNPYQAAAETQRKADLRRKLLSAGAEIDGGSDIEGSEFGTAVRLMSGQHGEAFTEDEYRASDQEPE